MVNRTRRPRTSILQSRRAKAATADRNQLTTLLTELHG